MKFKQASRIVAVLCFAWPLAAQVQGLPQALPGIDGVSGQVLTGPTLSSDGALGLLNGSAQFGGLGLSESSDLERNVSNGLPGIDGVNFSAAALARVFEGLDPTLVRSLLARLEPRVVTQITQGLNTALPGLATQSEDLLTTLPGIDGLPVQPSR